MATFISKSPEETKSLGRQWGREAKRGWIIGLTGDLGAGKTQLVKGLASGMGIGRTVVSPTFAMVQEYHQGTLPLFHLDLYRLDNLRQIVDAGLEEYLDQTTGVTVVEWVERWLPAIVWPPSHAEANPGPKRFFRQVQLEISSPTDRLIRWEDVPLPA